MAGIYAPHLTNIWDNKFTIQYQFLKDLRQVYVTSVFRKEASTISKKHRPYYT